MTREARSSNSPILSKDLTDTAKFLRDLVSHRSVLVKGFETAQVVSALLETHPKNVSEHMIDRANALPSILAAVEVTGPTCYLKPLQVAQPRGLIYRTAFALDALASVWPANGIMPSANTEATADLMGGASRAFVALAAGQMTADEYRYAQKALLAVERIETLALQSSYFGVEHMDPETLRLAYSDGLERTALDRHVAAFISMKGVLPYSKTDVEPVVLPTPTAQLAHYTSMITTLGQSLLHNPALEPVTGGYRVNPSLVDTLQFADRAGQIGRAFATLAQGYRHVDGIVARPQAGSVRKSASAC